MLYSAPAPLSPHAHYLQQVQRPLFARSDQVPRKARVPHLLLQHVAHDVVAANLATDARNLQCIVYIIVHNHVTI